MITVRITDDARFVVEKLKHDTSRGGDLLLLHLENRQTCHACHRPDHWNRAMSVAVTFDTAVELEYALAQARLEVGG